MKRIFTYIQKHRISIVLIFIFLSIQLGITVNTAYSQPTNEHVLKSLFIIKAINFIEWPENSKVNNPDSPFLIYIYGDDTFDNILTSIINSQKIKIKNKSVKVIKTNNLEDIKNADILFIASSEKYDIIKILNKARQNPVLTIGDTKGYAEKGIMINLGIEEELLVFDINLKSSKESRFYISAQLLARAKRVI